MPKYDYDFRGETILVRVGEHLFKEFRAAVATEDEEEIAILDASLERIAWAKILRRFAARAEKRRNGRLFSALRLNALASAREAKP
jgi:hypothetical protein